MNTVTVSAVKAFKYQGRAYQPGDPVTMVPVEAAVHARQGHVSLSRARVRTREMIAEVEPVKAARKRGRPRKYRRADMTAEGSK